MEAQASLEEMEVEDVDDRFQKPNKYLKFLPISHDALETDADRFYKHVKDKLTSAILLQDIKQGAKFWAQQFQRYVKLYGLRFSKQDHIDLVKLFFELTVMPDLEMSCTHVFSGTFNRLVKRKEVLSPEDLSLPWRPVYDLWKSVFDSKKDSYGRKFLPPYAETCVQGFIKSCRAYWTVEATAEMLAEWRPYRCPFDMTMIDTFDLMALFLPTTGPIDRHDKMYKLWFDDFMGLYHNLDGANVGWETKLMSLFSRLAGHNIGHIDWEQYIPHIFSKILRSFGLPVGPNKYHLSYADPSYEFSSTCLWIVAMIRPGGCAMSHIRQFIQTIEPFLHPSNSGWWQRSLNGAISYLCSMFTARVHLERYKKSSWENYVPDSEKLTDDQITEFVDILKPVIFTGLFSKNGPQEMTTALFNLAFLRPERLLPQHLENLYPALENLTEPHRLKATLAATLGVARALVIDPKHYPEGRLQVIPILQLCLPGIDSNDSSKTMSTLQLITTLSTLVPLVDCSDAQNHRDDLTENERELCSQTAQFQDFIFIFLDRIFSLIEGLSLDHVESAAAREKASHAEAVIEAVLRTAVIAVFQQTSTRLFKLSFEKIWGYVSNRVFEVLVAGRLAAAMMYGVMRPQAAITVPYVIPHCCKNILELTENREVLKDVRADNALLWNLLLLSESLRIDGAPLVQYASDIEAVLERTLHMVNTSGHILSCNILERFMKSIGTVFPTDSSSVEQCLDTSLSDYLPIREWGKSCPLKSVNVHWHIPSSEGLAVLQSLTSKILLSELKYLDENKTCEREDLQRRLRIIAECLKGGGLYMPPLESAPYEMESEGVVDRMRPVIKVTSADFNITLDNENARNRVHQTIQPLMERLLSSDNDSAKPLSLIASIYRYLMLYFGQDNDLVTARAKMVQSMKKALENPVRKGNSHVRMMHIEMIYIKYCQFVIEESRFDPFTLLHANMYRDLMRLATSRYDDVQSLARTVLSKCFISYKSTQRIIIPHVTPLLITPPPEISEEQFKGAVGLVFNLEGTMMGSAYMSLAVLRDWVILRQLWPAIIRAQHTEKPAIQATIDKIIKRIEQNFETLHFEFKGTEGVQQAALKLHTAAPVDEELGQRAAEQRTEKYTRLYHELINELLELISSDTLQWKHREFAMEMVAFLQRVDVKSTLEEVQLFTDNLTHDSVAVRKLCIGTVTGMLYSQKVRYPRRYVPSSEFSGYKSLQYNLADIPDTEEKWKATNFVEKTHWGCTGFPEDLPVSDSHPPPTPDQLDQTHRYTLDRFSDDNFTDTLFKYLALEGKGKDNFSSRNYSLFKCLARNYGPPIVECCKTSIVKLLDDTDHVTQNSRQRLVAEFSAGIIRGAKYWSFTQMNELFDWLIPVLKRSITNVSNEAMQHWGTAFATCSEDREPRKLYRLFQFLLDEVESIGHDTDSATSLETTSRLYFLQGALGQQQWRVPELNHYTTDIIKQRLASPFKSIRSRLGSVLCSCYVFDVPYMNAECWHNPSRAELINFTIPLVKMLENTEEAEPGTETTPPSVSHTSEVDGLIADTEAKMDVDKLEKNGMIAEKGTGENNENKLIFKTMLSWLHSNFDRHLMYQRWTPEILQFIPVICPHTASYSDPELRTLCRTVAKYMSKALLSEPLLPQFMGQIKEAIGLPSWHARVTVLEMLQSMMFLNQFVLHKYKQEIQEIICHLLCDEQIEVKLMAATTLSGGIQCRFFDLEKSNLLDHFTSLANVRLKSKDNKQAKVQRCLAGILGLGAIVRAYPYDVPNFLPEVLMTLSNHVHDPQPIQKTVKDVLSDFKRTHQDNWTDHKLKFTDDQLVEITNLLVSPSYYA